MTASKGYLLLIGSLLFFLWNAYAIFISKLLPTPTNPVLGWIAGDRQYCLALPALIPAGFIYVLVNWFGFKYFQHN